MAKRQEQISIPKEHIGRVMNSLLCENLMGFERRLNSDGKHEWRGKRSGSDDLLDWTEWNDDLEEILDFVGDLNESIDLLQYCCRQKGVGYNLIYDPQRNVHSVFILEVGPNGKPVPRIQIEGSALTTMVCAAICGMHNFSFTDQHRALYPAHYLSLNS